MHWNKMISALHVVMRCGVLVTAVMSLVVMPLQSAAQDDKGQPDRVCLGFVVLASGHAVLSEESQAMKSDEGHKHGDHKMPKIEPKGHQHGDHKGQAVAGHKHQMGHRHGQAIVAGKNGLCVPIGHPDDTTWRAVSQDDTLSVMAESLRGALAHNSRANEGFDITIMQSGGKPLENADVQLFVRMPEHDHRMPGGHGPANDPDVKGLVLIPDDQGRYRINTVDFSMPGAWLLNVVVKNGDKTLNTYFASKVGEE